MVMSFNPARRASMIDMLVDNDINSIITDANEYNDMSVLAEILEIGFKGYENYTDEELTRDMTERGLWDNWFKDTE
jgi:hypothetical protein